MVFCLEGMRTMRIVDLLQIVNKNIVRNINRTIVTFSIITIGIFAFTVTNSITEGIKVVSQKQIMENKSICKITVSRDMFAESGPVLTNDSIKKFKNINYVTNAYPDIQMVVGIYNEKEESGAAYVSGVPNTVLPDIIEGDAYKEDDTQVVILPSKVQIGENSYTGKEYLGKYIIIEYNILDSKGEQDVRKYNAKVVGLYDAEKGSHATNEIYVPIQDALLMQAEQKGLSLKQYNNIANYQNIFLSVKAEKYVDKVSSAIRNMGYDTYSVRDEINEVPGVVNFIMLIGGGVSLLVMIIGMMNIAITMMQMTRNRRKEIGLMKAIGYTINKVMMIFMTESIIVSLMAGFFGLLLSKIALIIVQLKLGQNEQFDGININISLKFMLLIILISILIPIIASFIPLRKGLRVSASEALRSE